MPLVVANRQAGELRQVCKAFQMGQQVMAGRLRRLALFRLDRSLCSAGHRHEQ